MPNQWAEDGGKSTSAVWSSGSCGVSAVPAIPQKTQKPTMRTPAKNVFERSELPEPLPPRGLRLRRHLHRDGKRSTHSVPPWRMRGLTSV